MAFRGSFSRFFCGGAIATAACGVRKATQTVATRCDGNDHGIPEKIGNAEVDRESNPAVVEYAWKKRVNGISYRYQTMRCVDMHEVAPGVKIFRFALPDPDDTFALPPCSTVQCRLWTGSTAVDHVERFYTPCTNNGQKGHFDLIVRNHHGRMTEPLFKLKVGETMDFRAVMFKLKYKPNRWEEIGMICGGSGVTPMLQLIREAIPMGSDDPYYQLISGMSTNAIFANCSVVTDPAKLDDKTKISLLFANRSEDSVFLKEYFDKLAEVKPDRFRVDYVINQKAPGSNWKYHVGLISKEMITATMPKPKKGKTMTMLCGPDAMITHLCGGGSAVLGAMHMGSANVGGLRTQGQGGEFANTLPVQGILGELGYDQETVYRF